NIAALFQQNYPAYEIVFVTDRPDDPALGVVEEVRQSWQAAWQDASYPATQRVVAGPATESGQKVHNLRAAVLKVDPRSEVLVFVDTDARPNSGWLRLLVAPLIDDRLGASTGYRWFIPLKGGLASHLRSVWNSSIASALGERGDKNFCWGGSTAIRRSTFDELGIREHWRGSVSDDFTMTRVLQEAGLPICFVPGCLVASLDQCAVRELLEFTNRQLKITRVYAPHLWKSVLTGSLLFCAVFFSGVALVIVRGVLGLAYIVPLVLVFLIYALGIAKAYIRLQAVSVALVDYPQQLSNSLPAHMLLWPLASALFLINAVAAACSRRISWRGITYDLKSPTEAVIISRGSDKL
ncbi:MAG: glycosyltransferase family 2 protein, partial [Acidobacteriota bacterium]|nr:glycosyltransferase family 2 protein [Acidobacteriota bacterium]